MSDYIIETRDVSYTYEGADAPSLDKVSIRIRKGVKTVILGANGAGKSTLFYHFNGICRPSSGEVAFMDAPLGYRKKHLRELRSKVAVVLQNPDDQTFKSTVEADIAYGPENLGLPKDEVDRRVDKALFQVGLEEFRGKNTLQLSYGQRKRLALAGALAMEPEVLIMDEPTAGLDPQMAMELMELAEQLHHNGTDVIISTHDVDLAYAWADEIHVLRKGKLIFSGTSEEFYSDRLLVYSAGVMQPSMFLINRNLCDMKGIIEHPCPRTETQLISKMASCPKGKMFVMPVGDRLDKYMMDDVLDQTGPVTIGLYGTDSRRLLYASGLYADFVFNGFESCMEQCLRGHNTLLLCDESCVDLIGDKIFELQAFGSHVEYTVLGP